MLNESIFTLKITAEIPFSNSCMNGTERVNTIPLLLIHLFILFATEAIVMRSVDCNALLEIVMQYLRSCHGWARTPPAGTGRGPRELPATPAPISEMQQEIIYQTRSIFANAVRTYA